MNQFSELALTTLQLQDIAGGDIGGFSNIIADAVTLPAFDQDTTLVIAAVDLLAGASHEFGAPLTVVADSLTVVTGQAVIGGSGPWDLTPVAGWYGSVSVRYEIHDGIRSATNSASVTINEVVVNPNTVSVLTLAGDGELGFPGWQPVSYDYAVTYDTDTEDGNVLAYDATTPISTLGTGHVGSVRNIKLIDRSPIQSRTVVNPSSTTLSGDFPTITFAGDFLVKCFIRDPGAAADYGRLFSDGTDNNRLRTQSGSTIEWTVNGVNLRSDSGTVAEGRVNEVWLRRDGDYGRLYIDGVIRKEGVIGTAPVSFSAIYKGGAGTGKVDLWLADLDLIDLGTPSNSRFYPLDESDGTVFACDGQPAFNGTWSEDVSAHSLTYPNNTVTYPLDDPDNTGDVIVTNGVWEDRSAPARVWTFGPDSIHPACELAPVTVAINEHAVSSVISRSPQWAITKLKLAFSNWYTESDGSTDPERTPGNSITVRAAIFVGGSKVGDILFGGQQEVVIPDGESVWCDDFDLALNDQDFEVRTYSHVPIGSARVGCYDSSSGGYQYSTGIYNTSVQGDALALLDGGTVADNNNFGQHTYSFGPSLALCDGWDGRDVVLVVGDSIAYGNSFGHSYVTTGLEQNSDRTPYANFAVQGTRPSQQHTLAPTEYLRKMRLLKSAQALNNGATPFTWILSEHGVNDAAGGEVGQSRVKGNNLYNDVMDFLLFMQSHFPDTPISQTTYPPKTGGDLVYFNTDLATQLAGSQSGPTADRWYAAELLKDVPSPLHSVIDVRGAWTDPQDDTVWYMEPWEGLLTRACVGADTSLYVDNAYASLAGAYVVMDCGGASPTATFSTIDSVTDIGGGEWRIDLSGTASGDFAIGTNVRITICRDGTHPIAQWAWDKGGAVVRQWRDVTLKTDAAS